MFRFLLLSTIACAIDESELRELKRTVFKKRTILSEAARQFIDPISYMKPNRVKSDFLEYDVESVGKIIDENFQGKTNVIFLLKQFLSLVSKPAIPSIVDAYHTTTQISLLDAEIPLALQHMNEVEENVEELESNLRLSQGTLDKLMTPFDPERTPNEDLATLEIKYLDILLHAGEYRQEINVLSVEIRKDIQEKYNNRIWGFQYMMSQIDELDLSEEGAQDELISIRNSVMDFIDQLPRVGFSRDMISVLLWGPLEDIVDRMNAAVFPQGAPVAEPLLEEYVLDLMDLIEKYERLVETAKNELIQAKKTLYSLKANKQIHEKKKKEYFGKH
jgi:hypothetical protein